MQGHLKTLRFGLVLLFCFLVGSISAQSVSGNVVDEQGEAVIGATVMEKGTKNATVTDFDGNFTIKLGERKVLVISYIGMVTQEVNVAGKSNVKVVMKEDATTLQDIVVVGYGTMKKTDLTGSVSSVDTEKLNAKGAASVMGNLQGSTPGVNITQSSGRTNGDFNIEIRGKASINSGTTPLYVVDGVMCDDINFLNPQDIERIDVLKDASSTAIYGSRATAGVVMVTTKSGAGVKKDQKATISYDGYYGFTKATRMPDFQDGSEFYKYRFMKFLTYADPTFGGSQAQPAYSIGGATLDQCLLRKTTDADSPYVMKQMLESGQTFNWPNTITQTGQQQNHFLAVSGGSEKVNYHFGAGFNNNKGVYKGDNMRRFNFKGSVDARINKVLSAGFSINVANIKNEYANDNAVKYAYRMNPYMRPYDADGNVIHLPGNTAALGTAVTEDQPNGTKYQFSDQQSTLDLMKNAKKERETWRLLGNFYIKFDLMKGLDFKSTFSPNFTSYRQGAFEGYINPNDPDGKFYDTGMTENTATLTNQRGFSWTWDNIINYNTTIAEDHSLGVMGLFSMQSSNTENTIWAATGVTNLTDWWNMNSGTFNKDDSKNSYTENSMISYAARVNYNWKQRYLLTATARWDGSSKFAKGHRWGFFPSIALAWRITEENFMKNVGWLSNLKFRVSYGVTGNNSGVGNYATVGQAGHVGSYPFGSTYVDAYGLSAFTTSALAWEKSNEINIGLDFGFLNNRINGAIDVYQKTSNDLLYGVILPYVTGYNNELYTNVGSVRNRGIEFTLTTINIQNKDWEWSTTLNLAHNNNKVREINGLSDRIINGETGSLFVGESVNNIYGYEWGGIVNNKTMTVPDNDIARAKGFNPGDKVSMADYYFACYGVREGQPYIVDRDGNGAINESDKKIYRRDPVLTGSFTSNLSWKNWDFSFSLYAKLGYKVASNFLGEYLNLGDRGRMRINEDWYIPGGTIIDCDGVNPDGTYINPTYQEATHYGKYPFPTNAGINGGMGVQGTYWDEAKKYVNASYLKVQNITLGYTFDKTLLSKIGCSHLRLYCTVTNPFVFTKYQGFDPEWADAALKNDGPSTFTCQFGASIKF